MGLFSCLLCPNPLDCKQDEAMNLACLLCHHTPAPRAEQGTLDCEKKRGFGLKPNNDPLTGICVWFGGEGTTLRLILCDPMNRSLQGSSVHGILQARILNGLPLPSPGDLPNPGMEPAGIASPALEGRLFTTRATSPSLNPFTLKIQMMTPIPQCVEGRRF